LLKAKLHASERFYFEPINPIVYALRLLCRAQLALLVTLPAANAYIAILADGRLS
jgi:hypothetical protein